ncbi:MAG: N-acetylmuramoyl-L-alanine amidase [Rhizobiaceae bacterium]
MNFSTDTVCSCDIRPATNFGPRADGKAIDLLIMHYTGMESGDAALDWLCREESGVSCHYFVFEDGKTVQMVPEKHRAWHAGESFWRGESDINSCSVGIEIVNPGHEFGYCEFPDAQILAVMALSLYIIERNGIRSENVLAHSDIAPGRKTDPGELFPWARLHEAGIGHYIEPEPIGGGRFFQLGDDGEPIEALQSMLALYGYGIAISGVYDEKTRDVVAAFQRHFRAGKVDGIADVSTITTLHRLLAALT